MKTIKKLFKKLVDKIPAWIFEAIKFLIIPAPLTVLTILNYLDLFVISNPHVIYLLFGIPAFFCGLFLYLLIKSQEENAQEKQHLLNKISELEQQLPSNIKLTRTKSGALRDDFGSYYCSSPKHAKPPLLPKKFHDNYGKWGHVCEECNIFFC